ncbi:hypothetical protein [Rudaea sp.]|uniref:hypothetical protein n=1 Tax=Rudaea sp. TaxID=2136325 RepID=UPI0025E1A7D6|nr:hypothetical protein [Rudaea sp.]
MVADVLVRADLHRHEHAGERSRQLSTGGSFFRRALRFDERHRIARQLAGVRHAHRPARRAVQSVLDDHRAIVCAGLRRAGADDGNASRTMSTRAIRFKRAVWSDEWNAEPDHHVFVLDSRRTGDVSNGRVGRAERSKLLARVHAGFDGGERSSSMPAGDDFFDRAVWRDERNRVPDQHADVCHARRPAWRAVESAVDRNRPKLLACVYRAAVVDDHGGRAVSPGDGGEHRALRPDQRHSNTNDDLLVRDSGRAAQSAVSWRVGGERAIVCAGVRGAAYDHCDARSAMPTRNAGFDRAVWHDERHANPDHELRLLDPGGARCSDRESVGRGDWAELLADLLGAAAHFDHHADTVPARPACFNRAVWHDEWIHDIGHHLQLLDARQRGDRNTFHHDDAWFVLTHVLADEWDADGRGALSPRPAGFDRAVWRDERHAVAQRQPDVLYARRPTRPAFVWRMERTDRAELLARV